MPAVTDIFSSRPDTAPDPLLERLRSLTIGEYEIRGELGRGGMAVVYLAKDIRLERTVAIKVMLPELMRTDGMAERFLLEARISARLQHPNIIVVHDVRQRDEVIYFVMSLVDGCGLDEIGRAGTALSIDEVRWVLTQAAQALSYANGKGIVHRDVKPGNILLTVNGDVLVTDFGIAKVTDSSSRTMGATIIGTPLYMSPEQVTGQRVSEASDQYSLGVTAYALLAGSPPFSGDLSLYDLQTAHVRTRPVPVQTRRPDCPPALAAAVMRMLEKRPADRWPSLRELAPVLAEGLPHDGGDAKRRLGTVATSLRDANVQRSRVIAIETPVTPRPGSVVRPKPAMIVVSPPSATLYKAAQLELSARVMAGTGDPIADAIVAWTSSDAEVASVTPAGLLLAVGPGTARIRAAIGGVFEEALVTVVLPPITRLELGAESLDLMIGDSTRPIVRAIDAQGAHRADVACSWLSRNADVVQVVGAGQLRAVAPGDATIEIATGTVRTTLLVRAIARPAAVVRVLSDASTIECGDALALRAEAVDDHGASISMPKIAWSSDAPHVLHVDSAGTAIGLSPGTATITAAVDGVIGELCMSVVEPPIGSITVTVEPITLEPGDTAHIALLVTDSVGRTRSDTGITVESDNDAVARVESDHRTLIALAPGDVRITARVDVPAVQTPVAAASALVSVRMPTVARVQLSSQSLDLEIGAVFAVSARCQDSKRRVLADALMSWESLHPEIASVDEHGQVRALAAGEAVVRVTAFGAHDSSVTAELPVRVRQASVASVRLSAASPRLVVGTEQSIRLHVVDSAGATVRDRAPSWSSSDPRIASVDDVGVVRGLAPGRVTISAELDGQRGQIEWQVDPAPIVGLRIDAPEGPLVVGDAVRCGVLATDTLDQTRPITVSWSVSPDFAATVNGDGTLQAHQVGTILLIAEAAGLRDERMFEVNAPTVASVKIDRPTSRLRVGAKVPLSARALRSDGRVIDGVPLNWTVADPECVDVSADGTITALRAGTTTVSVLAAGHRDELVVTVPEPRAPIKPVWFALGAGVSVIAFALFWWSRQPPPDVEPPPPVVDATAEPEGIVMEYQLPPGDGVPVGGRLLLRVLSRRTREAVPGITWRVSPDGIATVDQTGELIAMRAGDVQVTAVAPTDSLAMATITILAVEPEPPEPAPPRGGDSDKRRADSIAAERRQDSIRAQRERFVADSTAAAAREERRIRDSAAASVSPVVTTPVPDPAVARIPTDAEVSSAIDGFVTRFKAGEFRSTSELTQFFATQGRDIAYDIRRVGGNPAIVRSGSTVDVTLVLEVERRDTGPRVVRRVTFKLRSQGTGDAMELRPVETGPLVRP